MELIFAVVAGLFVGALAVWFGVAAGLRKSVGEATDEVKKLTGELAETKAALSGIQGEKTGWERLNIELRGELDGIKGRLGDVQREFSELQSLHAGLKSQAEEREAGFARREEELKVREASLEERLKEAFENLSHQTLKDQMEAFLTRSQEQLKQYEKGAEHMSLVQREELEKLMTPMRERLKELDDQNRSMEQKRAGAYGELMEQIKALGEEQTGLRKETNRLVKALQDPGSAGQWGEMVLERVVEMAGLEERVSFETQATMATEDGRQRPDMKISLPGGRVLIVDSKAPMRQYLEGLETVDEVAREVLFRDHAKKVAEHARALGGRKYTDFAEAPDFTIMFVPSESAFRVAVEARPGLLEEAMGHNVVIATPSTMLALLRAVAYGWRQERLAAEAREVQKMGQELYDRICTMVGHYNRAAKALNSASSALNDMGRSMETRVLPSARRFKEAGVETSKELGERTVVESAVQELAGPEPGGLPGL